MMDMKNLAVTAGVGLIGVLIGNAIGSSQGEDPVAAQLEALRGEVASLSGVSESVTALEGEVASLGGKVSELATASGEASASVATMGEGMDAIDKDLRILGARLEGVETGIGVLDDDLLAIEEALTTLDGDVRAMSTAMEEGFSGAGEELAGLAAQVGSMKATAAAPQAGGEAAAQPEPAAEAQPELTETEKLAEQVGETGLILSVGQTGQVGETGLFLSRMPDGEAHLLVVGTDGERIVIGGTAGAVELANGCTVSLAGSAESKAYIATDCP